MTQAVKQFTLRTLADKQMHGVRREDGALCNVPPQSIHEEAGFNLREDYDAPDVAAQIESLKKSYIRGDEMPPLMVRVGADNEIYVVDGHLRRRAMLKAIEEGYDIPFARCMAVKSNGLDRIKLMIRAGEGLKYKALELAFGYRRLNRLGLSPAEIAEAAGRSISHVEHLLLLADAENDVHQMVRSGAVAATTAIEAVRAHHENAGEYLNKLAAKRPSEGKRVSQAALQGLRLTGKTSQAVAETLSSVAKLLPVDARERVIGLRDGSKVQVPVDVYLKMLDCLDLVRESEAKRARKMGDHEAVEPETENASEHEEA